MHSHLRKSTRLWYVVRSPKCESKGHVTNYMCLHVCALFIVNVDVHMLSLRNKSGISAHALNQWLALGCNWQPKNQNNPNDFEFFWHWIPLSQTSGKNNHCGKSTMMFFYRVFLIVQPPCVPILCLSQPCMPRTRALCPPPSQVPRKPALCLPNPSVATLCPRPNVNIGWSWRQVTQETSMFLAFTCIVVTRATHPCHCKPLAAKIVLGTTKGPKMRDGSWAHLKVSWIRLTLGWAHLSTPFWTPLIPHFFLPSCLKLCACWSGFQAKETWGMWRLQHRH